MKKIRNLLVWACLLIPMVTLAGKESRINYEKKLNFSFNVNNNAHFQLTNKYGDITFYSWDKNVISATVTITVKADNQEDAKRIANGIQIEKSQSGNNVSLTTNYSSGGSSTSFWNLFFGGGMSSQKNISIDYKVYLPRSLGVLNVVNKYGDISGNQVPGAVNVTLHYGHIHLSDIQRSLNLEVKYGEGSITDVTGANIQSAYTDFHLDKIKRLNMHYEYGDLKIGSLGSARFDGSYGDIYAGQITDLQSTTSYSDYRIAVIGSRAVIETSYGDVEINKTSSNLKQLSVTLRYSDLSVGFPANLPMRIEANLQYGDLDTDLRGLRVVKAVEKSTQTSYVAQTQGGSGAVVQISGKYGDVDLENN